MFPTPTETGTVAFGDHETWYRITGPRTSSRPPLVVVHGGPGMSHDYLLRLCDLAGESRAVIHYDQVGSGRSSHCAGRGAEFFTVGLFLDELDNLLQRLNVADSYHLLGQSWGGMLAAEHAVRQPAGLQSLILSNSPASMPLWIAETARLRARLPEETRATLERFETSGDTSHPQYEAATRVFYDRHLCRITPWPDELQRTFDLLASDPTVYHVMNGPTEFHCVGSLRTWSVRERLDSVDVPTLLLSGRFDEATPRTVQPFADEIRDARWVIFEESSHTPFLEEPVRFLDVVRAFLDEQDPSTRREESSRGRD